MKRTGFIGLLFALGLLLAMISASSVTAAVQGTVVLDKSFVTSDPAASGATRTVKITVEDADIDVAVTQTNETTDFGGKAYEQTAGGAEGDTFLVRVKKFPILDNTGDGVVNFQDAVASIASLSIFSVSTAEGLITLRKEYPIASTTAFSLTYKAADLNNTGTLVTVKGADAGFKLQLNETGPATGKFEGTFEVSETVALSSSTTVPAILKVVDGTTVIVTYQDADPDVDISATSVVEKTKPLISNISPVNKAATNVLSQKLSYEVSDIGSGLKKEDLTNTDFVLVSVDTGVGNLPAVGTITKSTATVTEVSTGVFRVEALLQAITGSVQGTLTWRVSVTDKAGNTALSDADPDTAGNQDHTLRIDNVAPVLTNARTGDRWDLAALKDEEFKTSSNQKDIPTSLRVEFNENMLGSSLQATDFKLTIAGATVTPSDVQFFDKDDQLGVCIRCSVFLTVPTLPASERPKVELASGASVADAAGNTLISGSVANAADGISPALTVTVDTTHTTQTFNVDVVSDEAITGLPTLTLDPTLAVTETSVTGTNTFRFKFNGTLNEYNIEVSAVDSNNNTGKAGQSDRTKSGSIVVEVDKTLPPATAAPADEGTKTFTDPFFFKIDWSSEGKEYGLSAVCTAVSTPVAACTQADVDGLRGAPTLTNIDKDRDTHGTVTLTKAALDGVDVLSQFTTTDNIVFLLPVTNISVAKHKLVYNGQDELGNKLAVDVQIDFTVTARPTYKVTLQVGNNLVSIPGAPTPNGLNDIISTSDPIDLVFTYDPDDAAGPWLVADRDPTTGNLEGTLKTFDAKHAYWVRTSGVPALNFTIPSQGAQALPPAIPVTGNAWNMVPVISLGDLDDIKAGNGLDADDYFGANWTVAFTFDTVALAWQRLSANAGVAQCDSPDGTADGNCGAFDPSGKKRAKPDSTTLRDGLAVVFGKGYWVWYTKDGTITP